MSTLAITVESVTKSFKPGSPVLKDVSLRVDKGEMVALIGASGSGKSTLIRTIAGLIAIDKSAANGKASPHVKIFGSEIQRNGSVARDAKELRSRIGIVFQQFNLVPRLSVLTNVCIGTLGRIPGWQGTFGLFSRRDKKRAMQALQRVGIGEQALKRGSDLSGGQQQRAAIARTLTQGAEILVADEPIASLDPASARRVMDILLDLNTQDGITVLVSLHQVEYAIKYCPRTIALRHGEVVYDGPSKALTPAFLGELYGAESKELFLPGADTLEPGEAATQPGSRAVQSAPLAVSTAAAASPA